MAAGVLAVIFPIPPEFVLRVIRRPAANVALALAKQTVVVMTSSAHPTHYPAKKPKAASASAMTILCPAKSNARELRDVSRQENNAIGALVVSIVRVVVPSWVEIPAS